MENLIDDDFDVVFVRKFKNITIGSIKSNDGQWTYNNQLLSRFGITNMSIREDRIYGVGIVIGSYLLTFFWESAKNTI